MPETTISQRSPLADYFDDQNISVQRHCIVVCWQHLLVHRQEFSGSGLKSRELVAVPKSIDVRCTRNLWLTQVIIEFRLESWYYGSSRFCQRAVCSIVEVVPESLVTTVQLTAAEVDCCRRD